MIKSASWVIVREEEKGEWYCWNFNWLLVIGVEGFEVFSRCSTVVSSLYGPGRRETFAGFWCVACGPIRHRHPGVPQWYICLSENQYQYSLGWKARGGEILIFFFKLCGFEMRWRILDVPEENSVDFKTPFPMSNTFFNFPAISARTFSTHPIAFVFTSIITALITARRLLQSNHTTAYYPRNVSALIHRLQCISRSPKTSLIPIFYLIPNHPPRRTNRRFRNCQASP